MSTIKGIYVRNTRGVKYADAIVGGYKTIETRTRDTLGSLVGEYVAVIRTGRKRSEIIGYVWIAAKEYADKELFDKWFNYHLVSPGSRFDCPVGGGKWCYLLGCAFKCDPYPVPANAVRHGRVWCEWEVYSE